VAIEVAVGLVQRHFYISGLFQIKNLEGEGPPEPVRLRTTSTPSPFRFSRRGVCGQGNGDKGMVVSLVDALVVLDLAQLGVVVDMVVPLPCRRRFVSPSTNRISQRHRHSPVPIPLSPKKTCAKMFEERAVTRSKNECTVTFIFLGCSKSKTWRARGLPSRCD